MSRKQEARSEETQKSIIAAAGKLFIERGYNVVTMREIAKEAGCSHTTIYIYFKDKEALLHQLSMPLLKQCKANMVGILLHPSLSSEDKLKGVSLGFVEFCLQNRSMYTILFVTKTTSVEEVKPELEINQVRIEIFDLLRRILQNALGIEKEDQILECARIYFYALAGIVGTYYMSEETTEMLMGRLTPTFEATSEVLLYGFKQRMRLGGAGV